MNILLINFLFQYRMLSCGHSYCSNCLTLMLPKNIEELKENTFVIVCPSCQNAIKIVKSQ